MQYFPIAHNIPKFVSFYCFFPNSSATNVDRGAGLRDPSDLGTHNLDYFSLVENVRRRFPENSTRGRYTEKGALCVLST